eukprot:1142147-Pelagomonas_calceolata.AAC.7
MAPGMSQHGWRQRALRLFFSKKSRNLTKGFLNKKHKHKSGAPEGHRGEYKLPRIPRTKKGVISVMQQHKYALRKNTCMCNNLHCKEWGFNSTAPTAFLDHLNWIESGRRPCIKSDIQKLGARSANSTMLHTKSYLLDPDEQSRQGNPNALQQVAHHVQQRTAAMKQKGDRC